MSKREEEIKAVLDTLYLSNTLHRDAEDNMWHEAKIKLNDTWFDRLKGRYPERAHPIVTRTEFDRRFYALVLLALEQAEECRKGKKALEICPFSAAVVMIQKDHYGVEFYLGKYGTELVDGFPDPIKAKWWAKYESKEYLRKKGVPDDIKLIMIGEDYY
jgi:hypothetical protein